MKLIVKQQIVSTSCSNLWVCICDKNVCIPISFDLEKYDFWYDIAFNSMIIETLISDAYIILSEICMNKKCISNKITIVLTRTDNIRRS
jgi:hypothetical protein